MGVLASSAVGRVRVPEEANLRAPDSVVSLHLGFSNYCRYHATTRSTPAMTAGIAGHVWTVEELLDAAGALE